VLVCRTVKSYATIDVEGVTSEQEARRIALEIARAEDDGDRNYTETAPPAYTVRSIAKEIT